MPSFAPSRFFFLHAVALGVCLTAGPARAQQASDLAPPAHIAHTDGSATLERDGQVEAADVNVPLVSGDRLSTTNGRMEVLFPDGTTLDLDEHSSIDLLSPTLLRLTGGRATLTVAGAGDPSGAVRFQIDTPAASAETGGPGEYRFAVVNARDSETELAVVRGWATLTTERGSTTVRAGERSVALDTGVPSRPQAFNSARYDAFDRWIAERRTGRVSTSSARYLPRELTVYGGAFDRDGSWQYAAPYGYVWYPSVAAGWQPYSTGYWSAVPAYGWTWVGVDRWSWPTHHYGRWGQVRGSWFWIPGRSWAPAWVSWASAPGYVGWSPLGYDGRPVFALDVWIGWTVLPRTSFGYRGHHVDRYAVAPHRLPRTARFAQHAAAPVETPRFANRRLAPPELGRGSRPSEGERDSYRRRAAENPASAAREVPATRTSAPDGETAPRAVPRGRALASPELGPRSRPSEGGLASPELGPRSRPSEGGLASPELGPRSRPSEGGPAAPPSPPPIYRAGPVDRSPAANAGDTRRSSPREAPPPASAPAAAAPRGEREQAPSSRRAGSEGGSGSGERAVPRGEGRGDRDRQR